MSLSSAMRKVGGLFFEVPEEVPPHPPISSQDVPDMDDLDLDLPPSARLSAAAKAATSAPPPRNQAKSVEDIVRQAPGPNLDEVKVSESQLGEANLSAPGGILSGATLDFPAIYKAANLPVASFGAEQMLEMLKSLPPELPLETRRGTVKAMLSTLGKTMGATPETIVADASRKLAALHSFAAFMEKKTATNLGKTEAEIAELEKQIAAKRAALGAAKTELSKVVGGCEAESDKLDDVLEFFSLDIGASKHAPLQTGGQTGAQSAVKPPENGPVVIK